MTGVWGGEPDTLFVGVLRAVLVVSGARSLKDRRQVVVSLRDRLRNRFTVSCHEVTRTEHPARAEILVTTGGSDAATVRAALDGIRDFVVRHPGCSVADVRVQVLAWSGGEADLGRRFGEGDDV